MLVVLLALSQSFALEKSPHYVQNAAATPSSASVDPVEGVSWKPGALQIGATTDVSAKATRTAMIPYRAGMKALLQSEHWYAGDTTTVAGSTPWIAPILPVLDGSAFTVTEDALAVRDANDDKLGWSSSRTVRSNYRLRLADDGTVRAALVGVQTITMGRGRSVTNTDTMVVYTDGLPSAIYQSKTTWNGVIESLTTLEISDAGALVAGTVAVVTPVYESPDEAWTASLVLP